MLTALLACSSGAYTEPSSYLDIQKNPSPNYREGRGTNRIEGIVVHSTEGSGKGALNWLTSKQSKASAHYLIEENGTVHNLVDDKDTAWHVGKSNSRFLGIEVAGYANKPGASFTEQEYDGLARLTTHLLGKHGLARDKVVSHEWITKNIGGTTHTDPGKNFDWNKFNAYLDKYQKK